MSAIIANYALVLKDAADPSTSTAAANLSGDRYSEIIPLERAFVGDIQLNFVAGPAGTLYFQVSQDFGVGDDKGVERLNSENIITNWANHSNVVIGATDTTALLKITDIGSRWGRLFYDSSSGTGAVSSCRANIKGW
jgi:hypothetical protein